VSYEIIESDDMPPYRTREVRLSDTAPNGLLTFASWAEAKTALLDMLAADITEARERLQVLRWNRMDLRRTRKAEADGIKREEGS